MLSERELSAAIGSTAYGPDGEKIGTVEHFFADDRTGAPTWMAVSTGLLGTRHSVVPAAEATFADGAVRLPVTKDAVRTAPAVSDEHLDPEAEALLRRHYGLETAAGVPAAGTAPAPSARGEETVRRDETAGAPDAGMIRSEEQLRVGTERVAARRARLVKYVVTEEVTLTVPIRREEIRVEEVPVGGAAPAPGESLVPAEGDAEIGGGLPEEIVLHAERPLVSVEVVPVERVRLRTEVVHGQEQVTDQVQREQIVVDEDRRTGGDPGR